MLPGAEKFFKNIVSQKENQKFPKKLLNKNPITQSRSRIVYRGPKMILELAKSQNENEDSNNFEKKYYHFHENFRVD